MRDLNCEESIFDHIDTQQVISIKTRDLIEQSFDDFEKGLIISDSEMIERFGKYGWQ